MRMLVILRDVILGRHSWEAIRKAQEELHIAQEALRHAQAHYSRTVLRQLLDRQYREAERDHDGE